MHTIRVEEVSLNELMAVNETIPDFDEPHPKSFFEDRYRGRPHLIIVGYVDDEPAGYLVGYDRYEDGSFYCWMAGVSPAYRRQGVLGALMKYQAAWAKEHGYTKIRIKTRNDRREMLANLVKHGYLLTEVTPKDDPVDNRIHLEKSL